MKVNRLLIVLGAATAVSSCTNDEFLDKQGVGNVEGRPTVEVAIKADYSGDEASTRMIAQGTKFLWEADDMLGASRIDGSILYTVDANKHYSNAKFVVENQSAMPNASASFTTNNTLSVGSYIFYYPYSSEMTTSAAGVKFKLPVIQEYDPTGEKMLANNFMISPVVDVAGYEEGTLTLPVKMRSIYAYGTLNLELGDETKINGTGNALTTLQVQKVVIKANSTDRFAVEGVINNTNLASATDLSNASQARATAYKGKTSADIAANMKTQFSWMDGVAAEEKDGKYFAAIDTVFAEYKTDYASSVAANYLTPTTEGQVEELYINYLQDGTANGRTLNAGETLSTRFLIPAGKYTNGLTVEVYTDKGVYTHNIRDAVVAKRSFTLNLANPNRDEDNEATSVKIGSLTPSTTEVTIVSEADFLAAMKQYQNLETPQNVSVKFAQGVELTSAMVNAIPVNVKLIVNSNLTVNGDMNLKNMELKENVTVAGGNVNFGADVKVVSAKTMNINAGTVTLDKAFAGEANYSIVVNNGATLNIPEGANVFSYLDVNSGATVNLGDKDAQTHQAITRIYWRTLNGTANVYAPVTLNWAAGLVVGETSATTLNLHNSLTGSNTFKVGKFATVNVDKNITPATCTENAGTIVSAGTLSVTTNNGTITSSGTLTVGTNNNKITTTDGTLTVTTNSGTANQITPTIDFNGGNAKVTTNNGVINNNVEFLEGKLEINTNDATGIIYLIGQSQTDFIGSKNNNGKIFYKDNAIINYLAPGTGHTEAGHVIYTVSSNTNVSDINFGPCTALLIDGATLTIDEAIAVPNLQVATLKNATIVLNDDQTVKKFAIFIEGNCSFTGSKTFSWDVNTDSDNKITLKAKAQLNNSATITKVNTITIGTGASVINTGVISGKTAPTSGDWKGKAFVTE